MPVITTTNIIPATLPHIKQVLRAKHPGQVVTVLYRVGGEIVYSVNNRI